MLKMELAPWVSTKHQPSIYVEDDRYGHRYLPNTTGRIFRCFEMDNVVTTNSLGFHDVEHTPFVDDDVRRILVVGDSFTAGLQVPTRDVWTRVLESSLNGCGTKSEYEVINLGIDATGTDTHILVLEDHLPLFKPSIVILAFYENDIVDLERPKVYKTCYQGNVIVYQDCDQREQLERFVDDYSPNPLVRWMFDSLYIFRLPVIAIKRSGIRINPIMLLDSNYFFPPVIGESWAHWDKLPHNIDNRLEELLLLSEQHDFRLLIVPVPTKDVATGSLAALKSAASANTIERLEIVDVAPYVHGLQEQNGVAYEELFWRYDAHFNSVGHRLFGQAVFEALRKKVDEF